MSLQNFFADQMNRFLILKKRHPKILHELKLANFDSDEDANLKDELAKMIRVQKLPNIGYQEQLEASITQSQIEKELGERKLKRVLEHPDLDEGLQKLLGVPREEILLYYSSGDYIKDDLNTFKKWMSALQTGSFLPKTEQELKSFKAEDCAKVGIAAEFMASVHQKYMSQRIAERTNILLERYQRLDKEAEELYREKLKSGIDRAEALASLQCIIDECGNSCFLCREKSRDKFEEFRQMAKESAKQQQERELREKQRKEREKEQRERFWKAKAEAEARKREKQKQEEAREQHSSPLEKQLVHEANFAEKHTAPEAAPTVSILATCPPSTCVRSHPAITSNQDHALVFCSQGCRVHFHHSCWSALRPSLACSDAPSKVFRCPTPDCDGLVSRLVQDTMNRGRRDVREKEFRIPTMPLKPLPAAQAVVAAAQPQPQSQLRPAAKTADQKLTKQQPAESGVAGESGSTLDQPKTQTSTLKQPKIENENDKNEPPLSPIAPSAPTSTTSLKVLAFGQMKQTEERHYLETLAESLPSSLSPSPSTFENLKSKIDFEESGGSAEYEGRIVDLENGIGHIFCEHFSEVKVHFVLAGFFVPKKRAVAAAAAPPLPSPTTTTSTALSEKQQSVETIPPRVIKFCYPTTAPPFQPSSTPSTLPFASPKQSPPEHRMTSSSESPRDSSRLDQTEEKAAVAENEKPKAETMEVGDRVCFQVTKSFDQKGFFAVNVHKQKEENSELETVLGGPSESGGASAESGCGGPVSKGEEQGRGGEKESNKRRAKKKGGKESQEQKELKEMLMGKFR